MLESARFIFIYLLFSKRPAMGQFSCNPSIMSKIVHIYNNLVEQFWDFSSVSWNNNESHYKCLVFMFLFAGSKVRFTISEKFKSSEGKNVVKVYPKRLWFKFGTIRDHRPWRFLCSFWVNLCLVLKKRLVHCSGHGSAIVMEYTLYTVSGIFSKCIVGHNGS